MSEQQQNDSPPKTEYQKFELDSEFNYSKSSRPRIGFSDIEPNMIIFINNPYFDL